MTECEKIILDALEKWEIDHKVFRHSARFTIEEKEALDREEGITAKHCKNIFLTTFFSEVVDNIPWTSEPFQQESTKS